MRRLVAYEHGEPEQVLTVADLPDDPPPGAGEVQLAVHAVGLNFLDVSLCRGNYPMLPDPPYTPGVEVAGRVVAAGAGATELLGEEVIACPTLPRGALGETVTVAADLVVRRPADVPAIEAAGLPVIYQTGWFALERAWVGAGDTVLIHAGAGGVGIATTQLAVARGATVFCTAGGPEKAAVCRAHGAALAIDYQREDFVAAVQEATGGRGVDVVVDPVGGEVFTRSIECLAFEGRMVPVGTAAAPPPKVDPMELVGANLSLIGVAWGSAYPWHAPAAVAKAYQELFSLYRSGDIRPPVSRVVPLAQTPQVLADLGARRTTGKLVVQVGADDG
ncbi:NADPH:quinone oxidoreductase family protein [Natronosporangium hydrolyticum]|nr:NADPH:quinone oxidoreductase family protein [Natronosporangium hydrolyticum]